MPPGPLSIGIPLCLDDRGRWRAGRRYHYLDAAYAQAIEAAGGLPVYLPIQGQPERLIDRIDALLLPGGDDLLPHGDHPARDQLEPTPRAQLDFDQALLQAARDRGRPLLGICYGAQLLVLACGGRLHYHLPTDHPGAAEHRLPVETGRHPLRVDPSSRLGRILGAEPGPVNSAHHQGIAEPGPSLRAVAWSPDGLIEAVEATDAAFVMGVQWHPERLAGPHREALFGAFVAAARR